MKFLAITLIVHRPDPVTGVHKPTHDRFRDRVGMPARRPPHPIRSPMPAHTLSPSLPTTGDRPVSADSPGRTTGHGGGSR